MLKGYLILGVTVLVIAAVCLEGRASDYRVKWEAHVQAAQLQARKNAARADSLVAVADSAAGQAERHAATADSLRARRATLTQRIDTVGVPAAAVPFTAPRDTLIAILTDENAALRSVADKLTASNDNLRAANAVLRETVDDLNGVLDKRPKPKSRLIPTLGAGVMAGICTDYKPCSGVGLTLSWKL